MPGIFSTDYCREYVNFKVSKTNKKQNTALNQTVNDGVAHSRIGTLDQPVAAWYLVW